MAGRNRVGEFYGANELPTAAEAVLTNNELDVAIVRGALDVTQFPAVDDEPTAKKIDFTPLLEDMLPYDRLDAVVRDWHEAHTAVEPYRYKLGGRNPGSIGATKFPVATPSSLHYDALNTGHSTGPLVLSHRIDNNPSIQKIFFSRRLETPLNGFDFINYSLGLPNHLPAHDKEILDKFGPLHLVIDEALADDSPISSIEQGTGDIIIIPGFPYAALHGATICMKDVFGPNPITIIEPYWFTK